LYERDIANENTRNEFDDVLDPLPRRNKGRPGNQRKANTRRDSSHFEADSWVQYSASSGGPQYCARAVCSNDEGGRGRGRDNANARGNANGRDVGIQPNAPASAALASLEPVRSRSVGEGARVEPFNPDREAVRHVAVTMLTRKSYAKKGLISNVHGRMEAESGMGLLYVRLHGLCC
jgi:hypothetical protein